ncbi:hypothetical protein [Dyella sp. OK004]|uniref:hypothetical protein n=1 Tax=Dyella sp. OK004 TaxID=1855292 RepID=UPI001160BF78|nr:hypothetical protein [Dyella sp. OK004]
MARMVSHMSPLSAPARMYRHPASTGSMTLSAGVIAAAISATTITTGTGTTGHGWVSARE